MQQPVTMGETRRSGFGACIPPSQARRQLSVSLGVVVILALAILSSVVVIAPRSGRVAAVTTPAQAALTMPAEALSASNASASRG